MDESHIMFGKEGRRSGESLARLVAIRVNTLLRYLKKHDKQVIQCPALFPYIHLISAQTNRFLAVVMVRNTKDIFQSALRGRGSKTQVRSDSELLERGLVRYPDHSDEVHRLFDECADRGAVGEFIPRLYYSMWDRHYRGCCEFLELGYESMSSHPLWISQDDRPKTPLWYKD